MENDVWQTVATTCSPSRKSWKCNVSACQCISIPNPPFSGCWQQMDVNCKWMLTANASPPQGGRVCTLVWSDVNWDMSRLSDIPEIASSLSFSGWARLRSSSPYPSSSALGDPEQTRVRVIEPVPTSSVPAWFCLSSWRDAASLTFLG